MKSILFVLLSGLFLLLGATAASTSFSDEGPSYDYSASIEVNSILPLQNTKNSMILSSFGGLPFYVLFMFVFLSCYKCKSAPGDALYNGGIIKNQTLEITTNSLAFTLSNLTGDTIYTFSS